MRRNEQRLTRLEARKQRPCYDICALCCFGLPAFLELVPFSFFFLSLCLDILDRGKRRCKIGGETEK